MKKLFLSVLFLSINTILFSQEKSLLWEICGNGLEKSSFLYGTMHVSNKIAFRLDDVFYTALDKSECIGLESDPTEWLKFMHEDFSLYGDDDSYFYNTNFYSNLFKLEALSPMAIRSVIRFDNHIINNYLYRKNSQTDNFEEETYLDMFIYQAGKKKQKPIIGLEDFKESRYLTTKASYNPNKEKPDKWFMKLMEKENAFLMQEDVYRERNIELLDSMSYAINTNFYRENMLFKRNQNMVDVLDSIMPKKTIFSGVGAAHLGGEKGMINMLRKKGYTVKPLTSEQTTYAKNEKTKLENTFTTPKLSYHSTSDGFINIKSFDELKEFNAYGIKYYIAPDMTNGAYLTINRLNTFEYLPNESTKADLDYIKKMLYEDIPGTIIEKKEFSAPYQGISILNKTKKGDYQKYHIYKTPLEIIVVKFGGKKEFVLQHETEIFNSIKFKPHSNKFSKFNDHFNKYSFSFPENFITENTKIAGKKMIQGHLDDNYYFFQESPHHDVEYIEEDQFEAQYIHTNFYKDLKLEETSGANGIGQYKSYISSAIIDSLNHKSIWLKSVVKDGSYYLLGYFGENEKKATSYFNSLKFNDFKYETLKKEIDTSLHFTVKSPVKAPLHFDRYQLNKKKAFDENIKNTFYRTKANEQIFVKRTKFHDLQMFENVDSLWNSINKKREFLIGIQTSAHEKLESFDEKRFNKNGMNILTHKLKDTTSSKIVLVKYFQKQGVLYKLSTLQDSIGKVSNFISEFYNSFTPLDTLLGEDIFKDKSKQFFDALKHNDSIVLTGYSKLKLSKKHSPLIIDALENYEFPEEKEMIKNYLLRTLIENDTSKNVTDFITNLYFKSYSNPTLQRIILNTIFDRHNKESYSLLLKLMETDLPLGSKTPNFKIYSSKVDSLKKAKLLFPKLLNFSTVEEYKPAIYALLTRLKDSNIVKTKIYKSYKKQIINDAKIQIKRSLAKNKNRYYSYNKDFTLDNYVKLLFPFRDDKALKKFYLRLLESEDEEALTTYFTLLKSEGELISEALKSKTLLNESAQHLLISKLKAEKLLSKDITNIIDLKTYAKSKLFENSNFKDHENDITFLEEKQFKTDTNKSIQLFVFKRKNKNQNDNDEYLHYIAFEDSKTDTYNTKPYDTSKRNGESVFGTKTNEELIDAFILLIKHKTRKRITEKKY